MTDTDSYRLTGGPESPRGPRPGGTRAGVLRTLLWLVLVISAVGNTVASYGGTTTRVHLAFGVVTGLCVAGLVAHRLRRRR